jgi:hypothetical protein
VGDEARMRRRDIDTAARGNPALREALGDIYERLESTEKTVNPSGKPDPCQFKVEGEDGNFVIDITLPQNRNYYTIAQRQQYQSSGVTSSGYISHQLQCSTNRSFDASGDVRSYGPDTKAHWVITDLPDQNRYWRLRSSFDNGQTWNTWQEFKEPVICGIVPVWSGQVRAVRQTPREQISVTNYATVDSAINGGSATIRVYGWGGPGTGWYRKISTKYEGLNGVDADYSKV